MHFISQTSAPSREALLAIALYAIGIALLLAFGPADTSIVWSAVALSPLLLVAWLSFTLDRLRPAVERNTNRRTRPQRRFETQAYGEMALLAGFMILTPMVLAITGDGLTTASLAPALAWTMILKTIRWSNVPLVISLVFHSASNNEVPSEEDIGSFLAGLAISEGKYGVLEWSANIDIRTTGGVPTISGQIVESSPGSGNAPSVIDLSERDGLALMAVVTGSGNPYQLPKFASLKTTIDLRERSTHEKFAMTKTYRDAHERLTHLLHPAAG